MPESAAPLLGTLRALKSPERGILAEIQTFQDLVSGDEIISDTWNLKDIDDVVYEVDCKKVTKGAENVDIGANPSAEEQEEALDEGSKQVIDVVDAFRLNFLGDEASGTRAFGTKKDFQGQLKGMLRG